MCKKDSKYKRILVLIIFCLIFIILFSLATEVLRRTGRSRRIYQFINGFYSVEENTADAVYIGSSKVYSSWMPTIGWDKYGLIVTNYSSEAVSLISMKNLVEEVRKTQPGALIIINVNSEEFVPIKATFLHNLTDNMPFSLTKYKFVQGVISHYDEEDSVDLLEYVFPIIRYHTRWSEIDPADLKWIPDGTLGGSVYNGFLKVSKNRKGELSTSEEVGELTDEQIAILEELLTYCEKEGVDVLFTCNPYCRVSEENMKTSNAVLEYVENRGFKSLNLRAKAREFGINDEYDFYNSSHLNIHGAIKFTNYFAKYLIDNYGFTDKRGNDKYAQWDRAYEIYKAKIDPYVIDIEYDDTHRDYSIQQPKKVKANVDGSDTIVTWKDSGADGYAVYMRDTKESAWTRMGETQDTKYVIEGANSEEAKIAVIPYAVKDNEYYYGNFKYTGTGVKKQ